MNAPAPATALAALPETLFSVPGMRCAGCISKLENGLAHAPGIAAARVNFTAKRVTISHLPETTLPELVSAIAQLGFDAQPLLDPLTATGDQESRELLKALAVAGFAAMNIMLLSVSVWSGAAGGTRDLFHWLSGAIAVPTVIYAGRPFFKSAWGALKHGHTNLDVPISIGVTLATVRSLAGQRDAGSCARRRVGVAQEHRPGRAGAGKWRPVPMDCGRRIAAGHDHAGGRR